jgi:hypothetical protein
MGRVKGKLGLFDSDNDIIGCSQRQKAKEANEEVIKPREDEVSSHNHLLCVLMAECVDGWVWRSLSMLGVKNEDLCKWEERGKSPQVYYSQVLIYCVDNWVKFFHSEAEFQRWQEQIEIKHAELFHGIKCFASFQGIWLDMAKTGSSSSHSTYAWRTATMYAGLKAELEDVLKRVRLPEMQHIPEGSMLAGQAHAWREKEMAVTFKKYR